jgi:SurA N-terminal domain
VRPQSVPVARSHVTSRGALCPAPFAVSILVLIGLMAGTSGKAWAGGAPEPPEVVARVNGVAIARGAFESRLAQSRSMNPERFDRMTGAERRDAMTRTLNAMILREVQAQEARRRGLAVTDEEMTRDLEELAALASGRGGQDRLLSEYGITLAQWKEETRRNLLIRKLERAEAAALPAPDRDRLWQARRREWLRSLVEAADIWHWTPEAAP